MSVEAYPGFNERATRYHAGGHSGAFHVFGVVVVGEDVAVANEQGLTLVHFSAQLEPCLTHKNTPHTLHTPQHPLNTGYTTPPRNPYAIKSAQVELRSERVRAPADEGHGGGVGAALDVIPLGQAARAYTRPLFGST